MSSEIAPTGETNKCVVPATVWNDLDQPPEEVGQRDPYVSAVGASVFRRQPDLDHALLEALHGSVDNLLDGVASQLAPGVFRLAVGALVQAPSVDGDDFDQGVPPHLGQSQASSAPFPRGLGAGFIFVQHLRGF